MDSPGAIAKPYARAAFAFARDNGAVAEWSAALAAAADAVAEPTMRKALDSPRSAGQALDVLCELVADAAGSQSRGVRNLLRVMRENRRLEVLAEVARGFDAQAHDDARRVEAVMAVAAPMAEAQQQEVARALAARLGREVDFRVNVDEGLLGGARVQVGDKVLDGSVRAGLENLAAALARPATRRTENG